MSTERTLKGRLSRTLGVAGGCTLLATFGGLFVCSSYPTFKTISVDCEAAEQGYVLYHYQADAGSQNLTIGPDTWFGSPDYDPCTVAQSDAGVGGSPVVSPDASAACLRSQTDAAAGFVASISKAPTNELIKNLDQGTSLLCDKYTNALVLQAKHNNDWGGLFGNYGFGQSADPVNAKDWGAEGLAFWARAPVTDKDAGPPVGTTKSFTLSLDDNNTVASTATFSTNCVVYAGSSSSGSTAPTVTDPGTGSVLAGGGPSRVQYPDECGNSYTVVVTVTSEWNFYAIPFSTFKQSALPNRVPNASLKAGDVAGNGLLRDQLRGIGIRPPKEAVLNLWITNLAFYKKQ